MIRHASLEARGESNSLKHVAIQQLVLLCGVCTLQAALQAVPWLLS